MAQGKHFDEDPTIAVNVPVQVDLQIQDGDRHWTGIDFTTRKVVADLPISSYEPNAGISDDVNDTPDKHPSNVLQLLFHKAQRYLLRVHPSAPGTFRGIVDVTDKAGKWKHIPLVTTARKDLEVQEFWLEVDPSSAAKTRLVKVKH